MQCKDQAHVTCRCRESLDGQLLDDSVAGKAHLEDGQRIHAEVVKCLVTEVRVAQICLAYLALFRRTCEALQRKPRCVLLEARHHSEHYNVCHLMAAAICTFAGSKGGGSCTQILAHRGAFAQRITGTAMPVGVADSEIARPCACRLPPSCQWLNAQAVSYSPLHAALWSAGCFLLFTFHSHHSCNSITAPLLLDHRSARQRT